MYLTGYFEQVDPIPMFPSRCPDTGTFSMEGKPTLKTMGISEFKEKCIEELKSVHDTRESLVITMGTRPIATVNPYRGSSGKRQLGSLRGRMAIHGDIVNCDFPDQWEPEG